MIGKSAESADGFPAFSRLHDILDRKMDNIVMHDEQLRTLLMEVLHYD